MAMSLNGIIARPNNEEDFLSHQNWLTLVELCGKTGCIIWGRKTYEIVKGWEKEYFDSLKDVTKVIVTTDTKYEVRDEFVKVSSPEDALTYLAKHGFKEAILSGGSTLNSSFAKGQLIDEVIVNVEPVIIGQGIPLFNSDEFELSLLMKGHKSLPEGITQLSFEVKK